MIMPKINKSFAKIFTNGGFRTNIQVNNCFWYNEKNEVVMSYEEDEENAYRTYDDIVGRSIRRGTRKAVKALTFGLLGGTDPLTELGTDAAEELITKVIPRSQENSEDD